MKRPGGSEGLETLTPQELAYLNRFDQKLPVIDEVAAASQAGKRVTFLSHLSEETPDLIDDSDPGAMIELASRIASHIPPEFSGQQDQILNLCAAALAGATRTKDLTDILGLRPDQVRDLRDQTKSVLRQALAVELNAALGEKWPSFRHRHHQRIDFNDAHPTNW